MTFPRVRILHKWISLDVASPSSGTWSKSQYEATQMQAIAEAGFESVRVFMPFKKDAPHDLE